MPRHRRVAVLCALIAGAGCAHDDPNTDKTAEAARADSSAAGYAVASTAIQPSTPQVVTTVPTPMPIARDTIGSAATTRKPAPRDSLAHARHTPLPTDSEPHAPADSSKHVPLPVGPVRVNEFLTYDAQARVVTLTLVAGYNGLNDALNYNGGARGSQGVSVPLGWAVHVLLTNRDSDLQHSAIVVRQVLPPPEELSGPAFAGAQYPQLEEGVHEGDTASFAFVADKPGRFMVACGVPGHAQGGMWLRLAVSTDIDRPSYR